MLRDEPLHAGRLVRLQVIEQHDDLAGNVTQQVAQKDHDLVRRDTASTQQQEHPAVARDPAYRRQLGAEEGVTHHRCAADRRPGAQTSRDQAEAGFVGEDERRFRPEPFFLILGHSLLTQRCTPFSSRSIGLPIGLW